METDSPKTETESTKPGRKSKGGRNYVRKGLGNGGRRPGAGRPPGSRDVLPHGCVEALNAARIARKRLGEDASPEDLAALEYVYSRVGDVLAERVWFQAAGHVLKAAAMTGDALAGPIPTKAEITGKDGGPVQTEVVIRDLSAERCRPATESEEE